MGGGTLVRTIAGNGGFVARGRTDSLGKVYVGLVEGESDVVTNGLDVDCRPPTALATCGPGAEFIGGLQTTCCCNAASDNGANKLKNLRN